MKPHRRSAAMLVVLALACSLFAVACGSPKSSASGTRTTAVGVTSTPEIIPTPPEVTPTPLPVVQAKVIGSTQQDAGITAVAALGDHVWLAVNDAMLESDDRGGHWHQLATPPAGIDSLSFVSATEGWAGNPGGLYHTIDGGATWIGAGAGPITRVRFVDAQHGWIASNGRFLRTTDGGATWADISSPCDRRFASAFSFYSQSEGWYICAGVASTGTQDKRLFRTRDGGDTWSLFSHAEFAEGKNPPSDYPLPDSGYVDDLFAVDSTHLWISAMRGGVQVSVDGAHSWQPRLYCGYTYGTWFVSPSLGYAFNRGVACATSDGGTRSTWIYVIPAIAPEATAPPRTEPPLTDDGRTIAWGALLPDTDVSGHVVLRGSVWALASPCHETIEPPKIATVTRSAIFRQCDSVELIRSRDGGKTWAQYDLPGVTPRMVFVNGDHLRISELTAVYEASDDGATWTRLPQPVLPSASP